MSDTIEIRGLRVLGFHGALPGERDRAQPFELDLDVGLETSPAPATDDIGDTVDYGRLVELVGGIVANESYALIESLAESVAAALLSVPGVRTITVVLRKLRPPLPIDVKSVGVRITRSN